METQDVGAPDVAPGAETDGATRTLVAVRTIDPSSIVEGRVRGADGKPLKFVWVRFHPVDGGFAIQTLTDVDGNFRKTAAWDVAYDARVLVPGEDGRLVPGPKLGVVRGGDRGLELRVPR
jgi:hypothetical protein